MDVFEIILGTYESFVIGVKCRFKSQVNIFFSIFSAVIPNSCTYTVIQFNY